MNQTQPIAANRGAVLILVMIFTLMLAMVAAAVMQASVLQLYMAGNDQYQEEALRTARALANELSSNPDNFILEGDVGHTNCAVGGDSESCHAFSLASPVFFPVPDGLVVDYRVIRQDPLVVMEFSPGGRDEVPFPVAVFEIDVSVDGSSVRRGRARLVRGVAVPRGPGTEEDDGEGGQSTGEVGKLYGIYWREPAADPL